MTQQAITTYAGMYNEELAFDFLGAIAIAPTLMTQVSHLPDAAFNHLQHKAIWQAYKAVHSAGKPLDFHTIKDALASIENGKLITDSDLLEALYHRVPSASNALVWGALLMRDYQRRMLFLLGEACQSFALDRELSAEDAMQRAIAKIAGSLQEIQIHDYSARGVVELFEGELARKQQGLDRVIPTGFPSLDEGFGGWAAREVSLLVAPASAGKTSFWLSSALGSLLRGENILIFSLEMTSGEIIRRMTAMLTGVPVIALKKPETLTSAQSKRVMYALALISGFGERLYIYDETALTDGATDLAVYSKTLSQIARGYQPAVVIVDGCISAVPQEKHAKLPKNEQLEYFVKALMHTARQLNTAIVGVTHFNREAGLGVKPSLQNFGGTSAFERLGQNALAMWQPDADSTTRELLTLKVRDGRAPAPIALNFDGARGMYYEGDSLPAWVDTWEQRVLGA